MKNLSLTYESIFPKNPARCARQLGVLAVVASLAGGCSNEYNNINPETTESIKIEQTAVDLTRSVQERLDNTSNDAKNPIVLPNEGSVLIIESAIGDGGSYGTAVDQAIESLGVSPSEYQNGVTNAAAAELSERYGMPHPGDTVSIVLYDIDGGSKKQVEAIPVAVNTETATIEALFTTNQ